MKATIVRRGISFNFDGTLQEFHKWVKEVEEQLKHAEEEEGVKEE